MVQNYEIIKRLEKPKGKVKAILDTDTYNEIDDQYALAYMLKCHEKFQVLALHAAPFSNDKADYPKLGMLKSYDEIKNILGLMGRQDLYDIVYKGSETYLKDEQTPVISPAAENLVRLAKEMPEGESLYVIAIGAITNVASALLMDPSIKEKIVVVWLGGHAYHMNDNREFNLSQDIAAARVIFGCGVPVVQLPCIGVVDKLTISQPEIEYWLKGKNPLCDYLSDITIKEAKIYSNIPTWTRVIWDVSAIAWFLEDDFMQDRLEYSPIPTYDHKIAFSKDRHMIRYVFNINRDKIVNDLFTRLTSDS
ncbi:MAG: nucleoside hydrolase [Clostridiales bacterium]|nr:nucleoside hydrolase [Clostridiales bacterium]